MNITNYILLFALILSVSLVQSQEEKESKFSWDDIPESKANIGAFPYITAPNRLIVDKNESQSYEFDKLEMFNGSSFFVLDGKVERMTIEMDGDKKWEKYWFEKSVSEYLKSIGAILIFDGQIPYEFIQKWGETPNPQHEHRNEFYAGDIINKTVKMFVLKTKTKKIGFQIISEHSRGKIGVVEYTDFEQTIEKITADDILDEINTKGYATLYINFDIGKSRINGDSYEVISEIAEMMKANTNLKISIEGHTDNVGNETSNIKLSKNRAMSVFAVLITDGGIDQSRLKTKGFGQQKPVDDNSTAEGRAKNRRVELRKI
jgi:outer membrane protein OmpA-like peptidoglycan-associated protein